MRKAAVTTPTKTTTVYYVGKFQSAMRTGISGTDYNFSKNSYAQPVGTEVKEEDCPQLLAEKGTGCFTHAPERIFVTKAEYDAEISEAQKVNK